MPFTLVRDDITKMKVDAIVNAANPLLQMGGGVCGAIFRAAGAQELQQECDAIGSCEIGQAVITKGYQLPANYIIHTPGPVWHGGSNGEEELLQSCYINALKLAEQHGCTSIAFPLISSGIYGFPKKEALQAATVAIQGFLAQADQDIDVYLVMFDKAAFDVSGHLLGQVEAYIDQRYVDEHTLKRGELLSIERSLISEEIVSQTTAAPYEYAEQAESTKDAEGLSIMDDLFSRLDESFSIMLFKLIDAKGRTDTEVYKRANIDRKLFSKIRSSRTYMPSKRTAIALAIALELSLDETEDLLERAGYTLSRSQKFDVIIEYFIANGMYDIFAINEMLFHYDQPLLGS